MLGRRNVVMCLGIAALTLGVGACGGDDSDGGSRGGEPIRIGAVAAFSGPFAPSTTAFVNSLQVEVDAANKAGGIDGRKLEVVTKDTKGQPNLALNLTRELSDEGVKVFLTSSTAEALALKPMMTGELTLFMANPPAIQNDPEEFPYGFNFYPPNQFAVDALVASAKARGLTRWAVVSDVANQYQSYVEPLEPAAGEAGAEIVLKQKYDPQTTDFSPIAQKIKDSGADAIFFFAAGPPVPRMLQAVASAGIEAPLFGGYGNSAADLSTAPASVLEGQAFFATTTPNVLTRQGQPLIPAYGEMQEKQFYPRFGKKPGIGGSVTSDLAKAMVWAMKKAGSDDPDGIKEALESTEEAGGVGFTAPEVKYSFSSENHGGYPSSQVVLAELTGTPEWPGFYTEASDSEGGS